MTVRTQMTQEELRNLPVSFDLVTAGRALDMGRTTAHNLARAGQFRVRVLRVGVRYRVTRADLLRYLGEDPASATGDGPSAA